MKKFSLLIALVSIICACGQTQEGAIFASFYYAGEDACFAHEVSASEFQNPVLAGFFPDPSVCRKGDDYFMVNSTFSYFPGVPIQHSKDLVHWEQIGYVLNRESQLQLDSAHIAWGVYAPDIQYNEGNDTFYMVNTIVMGINNFFVKTKDPFAGNWSDPILLPELDGIDPSFFFDEDGKAYIVYNGDPLEGTQYDGHRAIKLYEFDLQTDKVVGECIQLLSAGIHPEEEPQWIEGPHIYKHDGKYFLMAAEGGTGTNHSEVILVADNVKGPYTHVDIQNPVLTQRTLPEDRTDKVTSTGHADLIWTQNGDCWAFFLGCRPYDGDNYNTGRETFLLPVDWSKGYPVILPDGEAVPAVCKRPNLPEYQVNDYPKNGNFKWTVDLTQPLDYRWLFLRKPAEYSQSKAGLKLEPREWKIYQEFTNPALLGVRQQHQNFIASTKLSFHPTSVGEIAGLAAFQNENANFTIGEEMTENGLQIVLYDCDAKVGSETAEEGQDVYLKITGQGPKYYFEYRFENAKEWKLLGMLDGHKLSTKNAGGFTGVVLAMYSAK